MLWCVIIHVEVPNAYGKVWRDGGIFFLYNVHQHM